MKLLTKTTFYFLITMVPLLAVAGFYLVNQFSKEINYRSDNELVSDEIQWIQYLETAVANGTTFFLKTPELSIFPTDADVDEYATITTTYSYSKTKNEDIPYRQLAQVISISGNHYQIYIRQSQEQKAALESLIWRRSPDLCPDVTKAISLDQFFLFYEQ